MNTPRDTADAIFARGHNCAQAVFAALGPTLGVDHATCMALASGLGAGVARQGEVCGAVTGAVLAIGLALGRDGADDPQLKARIYPVVQGFLAEFRARHGTIVCRELTNADLTTPEGFAEAVARGLHTTICPPFVRDAVDIAEHLIADHS